jgi:hypothetical protein
MRDSKKRYTTPKGQSGSSTISKKQFTGRHADIIVVDDPMEKRDNGAELAAGRMLEFIARMECGICKDCFHAKDRPIRNEGEELSYSCHGGPPSMVFRPDGRLMTVWPIVFATESCGCWKPMDLELARKALKRNDTVAWDQAKKELGL